MSTIDDLVNLSSAQKVRVLDLAVMTANTLLEKSPCLGRVERVGFELLYQPAATERRVLRNELFIIESGCKKIKDLLFGF